MADIHQAPTETTKSAVDLGPEELLRRGVVMTSSDEIRKLVMEAKQGNLAIKTLDAAYNWGRRNSLWPLLFGTACCFIEMAAAGTARYDISRFGSELFRATPRQADVMIVSGTVTKKMMPLIVRLYNQMPEPKYVMTMGACSISGGPFKEGYNVVSGMDKFVPVDVHVPGCPPTPEALLYGLMKLQEKIDRESIRTS